MSKKRDELVQRTVEELVKLDGCVYTSDNGILKRVRHGLATMSMRGLHALYDVLYTCNLGREG